MAKKLLPLLATVEELSDHIGEPIETGSLDAKRAEGALRAASSLVRHESGDRKWLDPDNPEQVNPDFPEELWIVVLDSASRKYLNPEGFEQEREDNWYGSRKVQEAGVYLTASELAIVAPYAGTKHGGLRTIATTREDIPRSLVDDPLLPPYYR